MKLKANDYVSKEIIKIIREWTDLSQEEFAKTIDKSYGAVKKYEQSRIVAKSFCEPRSWVDFLSS